MKAFTPSSAEILDQGIADREGAGSVGIVEKCSVEKTGAAAADVSPGHILHGEISDRAQRPGMIGATATGGEHHVVSNNRVDVVGPASIGEHVSKNVVRDVPQILIARAVAVWLLIEAGVHRLADIVFKNDVEIGRAHV